MSWQIDGFGLSQPCRIIGGNELAQIIEDFPDGGRVFVIVEKNVLDHSTKLPSWPGMKLILPSLGDQLKQPFWLNKILSWFYHVKLTRNDWVLGMGGGAILDLVGFAASIFARGVPTVLVPTTLLAQVDAGLGGKCAVNWRGIKNQVGSFYFPRYIFCALDVLKTLPVRQYYAGMAEVLKYQLLMFGPGKFEEIGTAEMEDVIHQCCRYKNTIVSSDPYDTGKRRILNLGHTLAHALEGLDQGMLHGEAVNWGLEYAIRLAGARDYISGADVTRVLTVLARQPRRPLPSLPFSLVFEKMKRDKKNQHGSINFVLPHSQGYSQFECTRRELDVTWQAMNPSL